MYGEAGEALEDGSEAIDEFVSSRMEEASSVATLYMTVLDDDGMLQIEATDENGEPVCEPRTGVTAEQRNYVCMDPRKWRFDKSMDPAEVSLIQKTVQEHDSDIQEALDSWARDNPGQEPGGDFGEGYCCDFADDCTVKTVLGPFHTAGFPLDCTEDSTKDPVLFLANESQTYGDAWMECDIELPPGETFDPEKLRFILHDYDDMYRECLDSALPVFLYGDTFYRLSFVQKGSTFAGYHSISGWYHCGGDSWVRILGIGEEDIDCISADDFFSSVAGNDSSEDD